MGWPLPLDVTVRIVEATLRDGFDTTLPEICSLGSVCVLFSQAVALCVVDTVAITASTFRTKHLRHRPTRIRKLTVRTGCSVRGDEWGRAVDSARTLTCDCLNVYLHVPPYNVATVKFVQRNVLVSRSVCILAQTSVGTLAVLRGMRIRPTVREVVVAGNSLSFAWRPTDDVVRELTVVFPNATTVAIGALPLFEKAELFMTIGTVRADRPGTLCAAQLEEVVRKWPRLQRLAISGGSLTSDHLSRIAAACTGLLEMSISRCPGIDSDAVVEALDARPSLRFMDLSGVGITEPEGQLLAAATGRRVFVV